MVSYASGSKLNKPWNTMNEPDSSCSADVSSSRQVRLSPPTDVFLIRIFQLLP